MGLCAVPYGVGLSRHAMVAGCPDHDGCGRFMRRTRCMGWKPGVPCFDFSGRRCRCRLVPLGLARCSVPGYRVAPTTAQRDITNTTIVSNTYIRTLPNRVTNIATRTATGGRGGCVSQDVFTSPGRFRSARSHTEQDSAASTLMAWDGQLRRCARAYWAAGLT